VGVDSGGTFTDCVRLGPHGLAVHKLRSTPDDPSRAILAGIAELAGGAGRQDVVHGSTVATNAVLERTGARVALVTTEGFEDVLRIGRQTRPELYNVFVQAPRLLVDPALTFGLRERLDAQGRVLTPVAHADVDRIAARVQDADATIVAVCLLHSYANPAHERLAAERLRQRGFAVCTSSDVLPEYREYERWSTTVVNAYVTPLVDHYLGSLETQLGRSGRLLIMQSNGGSISASAARRQAVRTILSGPAAGVVGARAVANAAGVRRLISFDMGGTSTDVSLIDGAMRTTTESRVGDFPIRLPVIDIHTVGAGGGSVAVVDSGGALRVGPRSAGAVPGPACYGTGTELTVTDANVLLGRIDTDFFLGGRMPISIDRAAKVAAELARALTLSVPELAEGIVRVANANMERAIRLVSVQRGHDPREFTLVAFGGAGGMHACEIAERLEIASVLIPKYAGVLSALGMLVADVTKDYSTSVLRQSEDIGHAVLTERIALLVRQAKRELRAEGFRPSDQRIERFVDVRYVGQSYELTLPFTPDYRDAFDRQHHRTYGYSDPLRPTEVVNLRVVASGLTDKPTLPFTRPIRSVAAQPASVRSGRFAGRPARVACHRWDDLVPGAHATGPVLIAGREATAIVPPGWKFRVDGFGNVVATRTSAGRNPRTPTPRNPGT
jgi:N-methylhydantoinase A/oxoprolinase/acetone carboxylase beta subunit